MSDIKLASSQLPQKKKLIKKKEEAKKFFFFFLSGLFPTGYCPYNPTAEASLPFV